MDAVARLKQRVSELERELHLMSSEIHDGLLQMVIAAHMMTESLKRRWPLAAGSPPAELPQVLNYLQQAMAEGRRLIDRAATEPVRSEDLVTSIHALVDTYGTDSPEFHVELDVPNGLDGPTQQAIYRLVQEALSNIRRHSKASKVSIDLKPVGDHMEMTIVDNGKGFDLADVREGHYGIQSMRRRVAMLHGTFDLQSGPGRGTRIVVDLPQMPLHTLRESSLLTRISD